METCHKPNGHVWAGRPRLGHGVKAPFVHRDQRVEISLQVLPQEEGDAEKEKSCRSSRGGKQTHTRE